MDEGQRTRLKDQIESLIPQNGTPLYEATQDAADTMRDAYDAAAINAVVLLTDGVNDDGDQNDDADQLDQLIRTLRGGEGVNAKSVRVFPIAYGQDADTATLRRIAEASNGALYSPATRPPSTTSSPRWSPTSEWARGEGIPSPLPNPPPHSSRRRTVSPPRAPPSRTPANSVQRLMATSFRDRFFTPPVAKAMTSPLGIVLAGVGAAVGLVTGLGIPAAIGLAAVAWGGRVAAAIPRGEKRARGSTRSRCRSRGGATSRARCRPRPASTGRSRRRPTARCASTCPTSATGWSRASTRSGRWPAAATTWTGG